MCKTEVQWECSLFPKKRTEEYIVDQIDKYLTELLFLWWSCPGSRRSRNRSRGQLLAKNSKATTLEFESDFDFETANAQFKDDLTKGVVGMFRLFFRVAISGNDINHILKALVYPLFSL